MNKNIIKLQEKWGLGNMQVFSYGNRKLPKETLVVNITSAANCPSEKLGFCRCSKVCYAKKCERIYKAYLHKNELIESYMYLWTDDDLKEMLMYYILYSPVQIKYVRLNEAGDFPNQQSVDRWSNIGRWLHKVFGIKTYCYTCREDLNFKGVHFIVNSSSPNIKAHRWFFCVDKTQFEQLPQNAIICKGDCNKCKLCYDSKYQGIIYCKQH